MFTVRAGTVNEKVLDHEKEKESLIKNKKDDNGSALTNMLTLMLGIL